MTPARSPRGARVPARGGHVAAVGDLQPAGLLEAADRLQDLRARQLQTLAQRRWIGVAAGRLERLADRLQVVAVDPAAGAEEAADRLVLGAVEEACLGGLAVAPGPADLLVVGVDRVGSPAWRTKRTLGLSIPIPKAVVATITSISSSMKRSWSSPRRLRAAPRGTRGDPRGLSAAASSSRPGGWRCRRCPAWAPPRPPRPAPPLCPSPRRSGAPRGGGWDGRSRG